ncbi:hypothetical protein J4444_03730 [Candidatus Woesearchaeota archaeon]|nr:hypothetical protein [Candidatus Woesearchaeota archaeon]
MTPLLTKIQELLDSQQISYEIKDHPAVRTSQEAAQARGESLQIGAKALLVKDDTRFVLLILPAHLKLDTKKAKKVLNSRNLRFATPEELMQLVQVEKGAVPPFGPLFEVEMIVDHKLFENEFIAFNAGSLETSIKMRTQDYKRIINPRVEDIVE